MHATYALHTHRDFSIGAVSPLSLLLIPVENLIIHYSNTIGCANFIVIPIGCTSFNGFLVILVNASIGTHFACRFCITPGKNILP